MNGMPETPFPVTSHGAITAILAWRYYGDPRVVPLWRSQRGAIMAILKWRHMTDHKQESLRLTVGGFCYARGTQITRELRHYDGTFPL